MMEILKRLSSLLATYTSPFIILVAVIAMFFPDLFGWVQRGNVASIILGLIMLTMGCTLSTHDFRILIGRPMDIFIGSMAQFTVMPLLAWSLSHVFHLNPYMSAGLILVGCCPGGVSSNIMSFLCRGDVAYSVGMTTASTLLAPFLTPLLVYWLAGTSIEVDVWGMFQNILVVTLIPICIGCAFNYFLGRKAVFQDVQRIMPGMSVICLEESSIRCTRSCCRTASIWYSSPWVWYFFTTAWDTSWDIPWDACADSVQPRSVP